MKNTETKFNYERFTNLFPVTKSLKFKLVPSPITKGWMERDGVQMNEEQFNREVDCVHNAITKWHKMYIESVLPVIEPDRCIDAITTYQETKKYINQKGEELQENEKESKVYDTMILELCSEISDQIIQPDFASGKKMIDMILATESIDLTEEEKIALQNAYKCASAYDQFCKQRSFIYDGSGKHGTIARRFVEDIVDCINNDNIITSYPKDLIDEIILSKIDDYTILDYITIERFDQKSIDTYNTAISGIAKEDGTKIQGINEIVNSYNQSHKKDKTFKPLPMLVKLKKIPLVESISASFSMDPLENDQDCINLTINTVDMVRDMINTSNPVELFYSYLMDIPVSELKGIRIKKGSIWSISYRAFKNYNLIMECLSRKYDAEIGNPKNKPESYKKKKDKWFNQQDNFDLTFISEALKVYAGEVAENFSDPAKTLLISICAEVKDAVENFNNTYDALRDRTNIRYPKDSALNQDQVMISRIKDLVTPIVDLNRSLSDIYLKRMSESDTSFYSALDPILDCLKDANRNYNRIRNYVTKDVSDTGKYRVMFGNPVFGDSFDSNAMNSSGVAILRKGEKFYLIVSPKYTTKKSQIGNLAKTYCEDSDSEIMIYKQLTNSFKTIPNILLNARRFDKISEEYGLTYEIMSRYEAYKDRKNIKDWNKEDERPIIEYLISALKKHPMNDLYHYHFKDASEYDGLVDFYGDVDEQSYKLDFVKVNEEMLNELISEGQLYIFNIYSRHLAGVSGQNGHTSLHTIYFKELFSLANRENMIYKLNTTTSVFYRPKKIADKDMIIHPAGVEIPFKTKPGGRTFDYDIIKDRRYTQDQYELHLSINLYPYAPKKGDKKVNQMVQNELIANKDGGYNILAIDRGEQNLIYCTVINSKTYEILEQKSLNIINGQNYREKIKDRAQQMSNDKSMSWKYNNNIKNLKEGYLTHCIYEVVELMFKYNAIIAMEKLDKNFKRNRIHVGYDVYSQFERALIDKLNFYINKHNEPFDIAGYRMPIQLTQKFDSFDRLGFQSGVIFYVNPSYTSQIDPMTGYINRFNRYEYQTIKTSIEDIQKLEFFKYNEEEKSFEIGLIVNRFFSNADKDECWTLKVINGVNDHRVDLCTDNNRGGMKVDTDIRLYKEWMKLFMDHNISIIGDIKENILEETRSKQFYVDFIRLFRLTCQIRNIYTDRDEGFVLSPISINNPPFNSETAPSTLPQDPDANDAYGIGMKAIQYINLLIKNEGKLSKKDYASLNVSKYIRDIRLG